ncbi:hypothetical protein [Patulibacter minatonensis]|uniref:hypothetical protein n=1 Tax=Patulibacter minatonensis TaxID=298163 RepID=UPI00047D6BCB|nr:hypothetical protein [Patulibacter minatonensis]
MGAGSSDAIGDPDAVRSLTDDARRSVVAWEDGVASPTVPLDELVPWWRSVADGLSGGDERPSAELRVGRDAEGRARIVEPAGGGPALAVAGPEDVGDLEDVLVATSAYWSVALTGPDGTPPEMHSAILVGGAVRTWTWDGPAGTTTAVVLGPGRGAADPSQDGTAAARPGDDPVDGATTVAAVRTVDPDDEPDPDRPADLVLRITPDAVVRVGVEVTAGEIEWAYETLMQDLVGGALADWGEPGA